MSVNIQLNAVVVEIASVVVHHQIPVSSMQVLALWELLIMDLSAIARLLPESLPTIAGRGLNTLRKLNRDM